VQSQLALEEMERLLKNASAAAREAVAAALRDLILTLDQANGVSASVRKVRELTLGVLRASTQGRLAQCFQNGQLATPDLHRVNFAGEALLNVSFRKCFLVKVSFQGCDLSRTTFAGAWIRNVDFADANLSDADLTDADWFNALGLTQSQLRSVRPGTLAD